MKPTFAIAIAMSLAACGGTATPETEAPITTTKPNPEHTGLGADQAEAPEAAPAVQNAAPAFSLPDLDGKQVKLADFRGKVVVLEWFNPGCPFVKYAYGKGPLGTMAKQKAAAGVVWLSINSGASGKQGYGVEANRKAAKEWGLETPILMDETGEVGKLYGAKTTPHMFVVNPTGSIVYKGALDNAPLGRAPSEGHKNFVDAALADLAAGREVQVGETKPYGCSVKY